MVQWYLCKESCNCVKAISFLTLAKSILCCFFSAMSDFSLSVTDKSQFLLDINLPRVPYTMVSGLSCYLTSWNADLIVLILW